LLLLGAQASRKPKSLAESKTSSTVQVAVKTNSFQVQLGASGVEWP